MAAARTVHKGLYTSDVLAGAPTFLRRVDDHFFTQANLNWSAAPAGTVPLPGTLRPRHAVGIDASGRTHSVTIPNTAATLWTQGTNTWDILDDTGASQTVTVTGLVGEAVTF